jgi:hypothetical protein
MTDNNQNDLYAAARHAINANQACLIFEGARVAAKITLKYTDARCTAYLWIQGTGISKGHAGGGGYDRSSAALRKAALAAPPCEYAGIDGYQARRDRIVAALDHDDGHRWHDHLFNAGFTVEYAL